MLLAQMISAPEQVPVIIYNTLDVFGWMPALQGMFAMVCVMIVISWFMGRGGSD